MKQDDQDYFERRAEAEIEMAQRAESPSAVQAHYQLATLYFDRIHGEDALGREGDL